MKVKKVILDMFCSVISSAIPVVLLQLVLLPCLSRSMSSEEYGLVIMYLSILNIVPSAMGNSLNNVRLVEDSHGTCNLNYNKLLLTLCFTDIILVTIFSFFYGEADMLAVIFLNVILSVVWLIKDYAAVGFRIKINYTKILVGNIVLSVGYCIGYGIYNIVGNWVCMYLTGIVFCLIYISVNTKWYKESLKSDSKYRYLFGQTVLLILSTILCRIPTYADKVVIYPILGGESVAVLYVATLTGKIITMVISPMSNVILTYVSKQQKRNKSVFGRVLCVSFVLAIIGYCACIFVSQPVLKILYPSLYLDAIKYITVTTATVMITAVISIIDPFILKFYNMKWQIYINGAIVVIYFALVLGLSQFGLMGFCIGNLLSVIIKLLIEILVFYKGKDTIQEHSI